MTKLRKVYSYLLLVLLAMLSVFAVGCNSDAKIENTRIGESSSKTVEFQYLVDSDVWNGSGYSYTRAYNGEAIDFSEDIKVQYKTSDTGHFITIPVDDLVVKKGEGEIEVTDKTNIKDASKYTISISNNFYSTVLGGYTNFTSPDALVVEIIKVELETEWVVPNDVWTADGANVYKATYSGANLANGLVCKLTGGFGATDKASLLIKDKNDQDITEIVNVGTYTVSLDETQYSENNYNISGVKQLTLTVDEKEVPIVWQISKLNGQDVVTSNGSKYEANYINADIKECIGVANSEPNDISLEIKKGGVVVGEILDAGTYMVTASSANTNYCLSNSTIEVVVKPISVDLMWKYGNEVLSTTNSNSKTYSATDHKTSIKAYYILNGKEIEADIKAIKGSGQVDKIISVGNYTLTAENVTDGTNIVGSNNNSIELQINKKNITVAINDIELNYYDDIPNEVNVGYVVYENYDSANLDTGKLNTAQWSDKFTVNVEYSKNGSMVSYDAIREARDIWQYDATLGNKSQNWDVVFVEDAGSVKGLTVVDGQGLDVSDNYEITRVDGSLTISLRQITIKIFRDRAKDAKVTITDRWQTEIIDLNEYIDDVKGSSARNVSPWYVKNAKGYSLVTKVDNDLSKTNVKLTTDAEYHVFSIFNIFYYSKQNGELINASPITFHYMSPVTIPDKSHIAEGKAPSKYAHDLNWKSGQWTVKYSSATTTAATYSSSSDDMNKSDLYFYPVFTPTIYNIHYTRVIDGVRTNLTLDKPTYTINDWTANLEYELPLTEIEGYQFKGWYYVTTSVRDGIEYKTEGLLADNKFRIKDYVAYEKIASDEGICLEARYEAYKCNVVLMVGDDTIYTASYEIGSKINEKEFWSKVDRKFGFIYIMSEVPEEATGSAVVIRVSEIPLLWIVLSIGVVGGVVAIIVVGKVKKRKSDIDNNKMNIVMNRLDNQD